MSFHFVQMADPQFGMFASVSEYTDEEIGNGTQEGCSSARLLSA